MNVSSRLLLSTTPPRRRSASFLVLAFASLGLTMSAQAFNQMKSFAPLVLNPATGLYTNSDGANPQAELITADDTLYGVAAAGGNFGAGTIFKINTDGSGFAVLKHFNATVLNPSTGERTNNTGASPQGRLLLSDETLYGTAAYGGAFGFGTVFKINTNGSGFAVIKTFAGGAADGANPFGGVLVPGDVVIGTTAFGGSAGVGTIFKTGTNGSGFSILHDFNYLSTNGASPRAELLRQGSTLYGTTYGGGSSGWGVVFKINTNGSGFTLLKSFSDASSGTNSDGASPQARLILSDGVLYGTTYRGGTSSNGTVFKVSTDGSGFGVLKTFSATASGGFGQNTNSDGANSQGRLVLSGSAVYGTAAYGGASGAGTIFKIHTNGNGFTVIRTFAEVNGFGGVPAAGLLVSGGIFYGTTQYGGEGNSGTIFSLPVPGPKLVIVRSGANVILTWPGDDAGFTLEATPVLGAAAVWNTVSPAPVINNNQNTVTNLISGAAKFYRVNQ